MAEFKGTKGKWKIGSNTEDGLIISAISPDVRDIATVWKYGDDFLEVQEFKSNIKLISCSKEMLEMLIKLSETAHLNNENSEKVNSLIKKITE